MASSKGTWSRLVSLNGIMFVAAILGLFWFLTTVPPTTQLAYLEVLAMVVVVVMLTGFLLSLQPQE